MAAFAAPIPAPCAASTSSPPAAPRKAASMWDTWKASLEEADALCISGQNDPVEEPYKSKYKAKSLLSDLLKRSGVDEANGVEASALIRLRLAKIALETEEPHEADKQLKM